MVIIGQDDLESEDLPVLPCSRYLSHMHLHDDASKAAYALKVGRPSMLSTHKWEIYKEFFCMLTRWADYAILSLTNW